MKHKQGSKYLPSESSNYDHCDDTAEKKHHNYRVHYREPMDLHVSHVQVNIPTRRPSDIRFLPFHTVSEVYFIAFPFFDFLKFSIFFN